MARLLVVEDDPVIGSANTQFGEGASSQSRISTLRGVGYRRERL